MFGQSRIEAHLREVLDTLRQTQLGKPGYAAGNILNMLLHLGSDLDGFDFSGLVVWQAYMQGMTLQNVNFSRADLTGAILTDTFGIILSVDYNPNGQFIATGTSDGHVRVWHTGDGQLRLICRGHTDWVRSVQFSPDGNMLASGSDDQTIRLWDVRTGQHLQTLWGHAGEVWSVCFSPDGNLLASGNDNQTVCLWNVRDILEPPDPQTMNVDQPLRIFQGHTHSVIRSVSVLMVISWPAAAMIRLYVFGM